MEEKRNWWTSFGKWNFAFFFRLIQTISIKWSHIFLYMGLEDKSVYEDNYKSSLLKTSLLGKEFPNPLGIAAGFDTEFKYNDELVRFGFGFEEFGTFTLHPDEKLPFKIHYLSSLKALVVNAPAFKNKGISFAQKALIGRRHLPYIAGISLASNAITEEEDGAENRFIYEKIEKELVECVRHVAPYCDYITLNLSHPQLPVSSLAINLGILKQVVLQLKEVIHAIAPIANPRLLLKVPLDISPEHIPLLCETMIETGVDGVIVGGYLNANRENRKILRRFAYGYITGKPIKEATLQAVDQFYNVLQGRIPIIASGGIFTGDDAFEMIQAGASLVQIHTAIIYEGPSVAKKINRRLAELLRKSSYKTIAEVVGSKNKH